MSSHNMNTYIGVDFGATFSKVSALIPHATSVKFISEKLAPTTLSLDPVSQKLEFRYLGLSAGTTEPGEDLECLKLALMEPEAYRGGLSDPKLMQIIKRQLLKHADSGTSRTNAASIFLKGYWDLVYKELTNSTGISHLLNVAITYPACWTVQELDRLKMAVNTAEIRRHTTTIQYVTEQVAAMYGILNEISDDMQLCFQPGDSVMVVDGGGVTMDSAIYKLKRGPAQKLVPGDYVDGDSILYGTKSLDLAFDSLVSDKLRRSTLPAALDPIDVKDIARMAWGESKVKGAIIDSVDLFQEGTTFRLPEGEFHFGIHLDGVSSIFQVPVDHVDRIVKRFGDYAKTQNTKPKALFLTGGLFGIGSIAVDVERKIKQTLGAEFIVAVPDDHLLQKFVARGAALWLKDNESAQLRSQIASWP